MRMQSARLQAAVLLPALLAGIAQLSAFPVRIAMGDSLPKGFYWKTQPSLARGSIVLACLPVDVATLGRARGYLGSGNCPGGARPVGKPVGAVSGDLISLGNGEIRVNGAWISAHDPSDVDQHDRPLSPIADGVYKVADGEVWLISNHHPRSWDSRYFGPVSVDQVLGELQPIFVIAPYDSPEIER